MRKTVLIRDLVLQVNRRNRGSSCGGAVARAAWNSLLEDILHAAGVYDGFRYLPAADVPLKQPAGIAYTATGEPARTSDGHAILPDPSRRAYHVHKHL